MLSISLSKNRKRTVKKKEFKLKLERKNLNRSYEIMIYHAATAAKLFQSCPTLCDPIDGSPPGIPSLGFSRQEHWSGLPIPSPMHESEK